MDRIRFGSRRSSVHIDRDHLTWTQSRLLLTLPQRMPGIHAIPLVSMICGE